MGRRALAVSETMLAIGQFDPKAMTDTGMWVYAGVITVVSLVLSFVIAVWWQRRKDKRQA